MPVSNPGVNEPSRKRSSTDSPQTVPKASTCDPHLVPVRMRSKLVRVPNVGHEAHDRTP